MGKGKVDWGFWGFWLTVATLGVAGGVGLREFGHAVAGKWFLYAGIAIGILCVLAFVLAPIAKVLRKISSAVVRLLQGMGLFAVETYRRIGAFLLGPIISHTLRETGFSQSPILSWTAQAKKGPQGSDFVVLSRKGCVLAGAHFTVRPDYSFPSWRAGFRLTAAGDDVRTSDLRQTVLFHIFVDSAEDQPQLLVYLDGNRYGPWAVERFAHPRPSFEFDFSIYAGRVAGKLQITVRVDKELIQNIDFPRQYAEQLVLMAWGDGRDFRVQFNRIEVNWVPV